MATRDEVAACLLYLTRAFPAFYLPAETVEAYVEDLEDLPALALQEAARDLRRRSTWFPRIGEIRAVAEPLARRIYEAEVERSRRDAWAILEEQVGTPDPARKAAVDALLAQLRRRWGMTPKEEADVEGPR